MAFRILVILALVWQPWACRALAGSGGGASCAARTCCVSVVTTTCCGERVVEQVCGMTGGECRCSQATNDESPSRPVPVIPRDGERTLTFDLAPARTPHVADPAIDPSGEPVGSVSASLLAGRSHREVQALLGVWRT
ncbi:MAG: hypothetical protein KDA28_11150 [Phycisphaerales bacterium]|nr:hypothetical protein [Phycisphaerales bacterium]